MLVIFSLNRYAAYMTFIGTKNKCKILNITYHKRLIEPQIFMQTLPLLSGHHDVKIIINSKLKKNNSNLHDIVYFEREIFNSRMTFPPKNMHDYEMPSYIIPINYITKATYDNKPTFTFECDHTILNNMD